MNLNKDFERNYFTSRYSTITGDFTSKYLEKNINWYWSWYRLIKQQISLKSDLKALEIGCGISAFTSILSVEHPESQILATDVSKYAIGRLEKIVPYKTGVLDVVKDSIPGKYDLISAFEVLEHLPDPESVFYKVYNALNNGGYFVFSTPYPYKKNWSDRTHINMHMPHYWVNLGHRANMTLSYHSPVSPLPYFYKYSKKFSRLVTFRNPLFKGVSTELFIFRK